MSILVLEDDPRMREVLVDLLEDEGYQVSAASSGSEAIALAASASFDLIVFDIRMEGLDGLETLARIQDQGVDIPSLAITGFSAEDDSIRALRLGVGDYLKKPFRPEQLLASVARLLARYRRDCRIDEGLRGLREVAVWATRPPDATLAALVVALAESAGMERPLVAELEVAAQVDKVEGCPERLRAWREAQGERYDGGGPLGLRGLDIPVQSRILALATAALARPDADALRAADPGRFDPLLLEALAHLRPSAQEAERHRLKLARTLAARGDGAGYRQLVAEGQGSDRIEACLALARLEPGEALNHLRLAVDTALEVGPLAHARALYRSGLLLHEWGWPQAETALQQACERLQAVGLSVESALVRLIRGELDPQLLEVVLRPENEPELLPVLGLLHFRVAQAAASQPALERAAKRLETRYPGSSTAVLRVFFFGGVRAQWGQESIPESQWRGHLPKYLFAFLAAQKKPIHEDLLLEQFWPEAQGNVKGRLSAGLTALRRTLNPDAQPRPDPVVRQRQHMSLSPRLELWTDLREFERAQEAARAAGSAEEAAPHWRKLADLHEAPFMEGCYLEWALALRQETEAALGEALLGLARLALQRGQPAAAEEDARRALGIDPLQPEANLLVVQAATRAGHPERAVRHFQLYEKRLHKELGLEPTTEMLEALQRARLAMP